MGSNSGYRTLPTKLAAIAAAALSTAAVLSLFGPSIVRFASSEIPTMYGSLVAWLTPPYLYFVVYVIIISIAASSKLQDSPGSDELVGFPTGSDTKQQEVVVVEEEVRVGYDVPAEYETAEEESKGEEEKEEEEEFVISRSSWSPKRRETVTEKVTEIQTEKVTGYSFLTEKPLVSERLGRRKSLKASPEAGRALGVARSKRSDTLESTWRAITDGRAVPLARHLKKSDTWDTTRASRDNPALGGSEAALSDAQRAASPAVKKDPSLGREELNRRAEAFIKKFNEEMRQESFKNYLDLVS